MRTKITPRVEIFINEYLVDFNVSRASRAAGYKHVSSGFFLLKKPTIAAEINRRKQKRLKNLDITGDRVLAEIARCAFFDLRKFYNPDGTLKKITELDDDTAPALAGLKVIERKPKGRAKASAVEKEYKLSNRLGALEMLGRYLNLFDQKPKGDVDKLDKLLEQFDARNERNLARYGPDDGDVGDGDDGDS